MKNILINESNSSEMLFKIILFHINSSNIAIPGKYEVYVKTLDGSI